MISRVTFAAAALFMVAVSPTQAAPFPAVKPGFTGTQFRGLALGQSRAQVEAALAENGLRCLTPDEILYGQRPNADYTTCLITTSDFVLDTVGKLTEGVRYDLQQRLGLPYYAVSFVDDVASALTLENSYFNAGGTTPYLFAQQIIDNYGVENGMARYNSGWRGTTANGEEVQVQTLYNGQITVLVVMAASAQSTPSFD